MKKHPLFPNLVNVLFALLTIVGIYILGKAIFCVGGEHPGTLHFADMGYCFGNILDQNMWIYIAGPVVMYLLGSGLCALVRHMRNTKKV
jgi:hypothetical protein